MSDTLSSPTAQISVNDHLKSFFLGTRGGFQKAARSCSGLLTLTILVGDAGDLPCVGPASSNYCAEEAGSGLLFVISTAGLPSP